MRRLGASFYAERLTLGELQATLYIGTEIGIVPAAPGGICYPHLRTSANDRCQELCKRNHERFERIDKPQRVIFARVPRRGRAAPAGLDDAAGGTISAGISGDTGEAGIFGGLQDARTGDRDLATAV